MYKGNRMKGRNQEGDNARDDISMQECKANTSNNNREINK